MYMSYGNHERDGKRAATVITWGWILKKLAKMSATDDRRNETLKMPPQSSRTNRLKQTEKKQRTLLRQKKWRLKSYQTNTIEVKFTWNNSYLYCGCRWKWTVIIAVNFQFKQLERRSLKKIRASTGFEPVTSAIPVRCSTNWAMKPYIGSQVNLLSSYLPVQWNEVKFVWNNSYLYCGCRWKWRVIIAVNFQFEQLERRSLKKKKKIRASTGFEPVTSAIPVRCSTNWAMKPHIGSDVNLLSSYLPVQWNDVKFIQNNSYLYCGCRWKWRVIIALHGKIWTQ